MNWDQVAAIMSGGSGLTLIALIWKASAIVQRLTMLEEQVREIDRNGCRHRQSIRCSGDN